MTKLGRTPKQRNTATGARLGKTAGETVKGVEDVGVKDVAIVMYPETQSLDFVGPLEVFAGAQRLIEATGRTEAGYRITVLSTGRRSDTTSSGLRVAPDTGVANAPKPIDTLIVAGGDGSKTPARTSGCSAGSSNSRRARDG